MEQLAFLQKRQKLRRQEAARSETHEPIDLFGGTPFGILTPPAVQEGDVAEKNDEVTLYPVSAYFLDVKTLQFLYFANFRSWCRCGEAVLRENLESYPHLHLGELENSKSACVCKRKTLNN